MSRYTHILAALAASALALAGPAFAGQKPLSYSCMVAFAESNSWERCRAGAGKRRLSCRRGRQSAQKRQGRC